MYRRVPDIAKIRSLTGWSPQRTLEHVIADVAEHERLRRGARRTPSLGRVESG
jgi:nucleoside-diphosphate-sugar epimerase